MDEIMVSIICNTYNHERYIADALDGFIMQKTNFKYEVLVHDDASTDRTADIIREYEKKYPDIIKPVYQTVNQHTNGIRGTIGRIQYGRAKGKYAALCEGDDFWTDENKLQRQFDAMESNPDCSLCVVKVEETDENGIKNGNIYPENAIPTGILSPEQIIKLLTGKKSYPFQTSGYFIKTEMRLSMINDPPEFRRVAKVGDVPLMMYAITKGSVYYIDEPMSCYRRHPGSWSHNHHRTNDIEKHCDTYRNYIDFYLSFDKYTDYIYHKYIMEYVDLTNERIAWNYMNNHMYRQVLREPYRQFIPSNKIKLAYYISGYCPKLKETLKRLGLMKG